MLFLRKAILLVLASGAASIALAAPSPEGSGLEVAQPNDSESLPYKREELEDDDDDEDLSPNEGADVFSKLDTRARKCLTRGRPKKTCYHSQCPGSKQCKVNARGNCVFRYTQKKRPFGCSQCLCYMADI